MRHSCAFFRTSRLPERDMMFTKGLQAGRELGERGRKLYLMGSLVALSFTVEEKEEWVLSSNKKDNAAFTVSKQNMEVRLRTPKQTHTESVK